jgi:hypothetical protein
MVVVNNNNNMCLFNHDKLVTGTADVVVKMAKILAKLTIKTYIYI